MLASAFNSYAVILATLLALIVALIALILIVASVVRMLIPRPILITFAYSHYCEVARWALEHSGVRFTEWKISVGPHVFIVPLLRLIFSMTEYDDDDLATSFPGSNRNFPWWHIHGMRHLRRLNAVPLLITEAGESVTTSWAILKRCGFRVDPELRLSLDHAVGPSARLIAYHRVFEHAPSLYRELQSCETWLEMRLFDAVERAFCVSSSLRRLLSVNEQGAADAADALRAHFAALSETTLASDPYLGSGDGAEAFGGADLAWSSLVAPLLMPPRYSNGVVTRVPDPTELGPRYTALREELLSTRAGKHAMRCYEEHRLLAAATARSEEAVGEAKANAAASAVPQTDEQTEQAVEPPHAKEE